MNAAMSLATMKPSQVTSGVNADFFEDIGPMANLGIHSVQKTFVDGAYNHTPSIPILRLIASPSYD
jgi:hypothetical protein